LKILRNT